MLLAPSELNDIYSRRAEKGFSVFCRYDDLLFLYFCLGPMLQTESIANWSHSTFVTREHRMTVLTMSVNMLV